MKTATSEKIKTAKASRGRAYCALCDLPASQSKLNHEGLCQQCSKQGVTLTFTLSYHTPSKKSVLRKWLR